MKIARITYLRFTVLFQPAKNTRRESLKVGYSHRCIEGQELCFHDLSELMRETNLFKKINIMPSFKKKSHGVIIQMK